MSSENWNNEGVSSNSLHVVDEAVPSPSSSSDNNLRNTFGMKKKASPTNNKAERKLSAVSKMYDIDGKLLIKNMLRDIANTPMLKNKPLSILPQCNELFLI